MERKIKLSKLERDVLESLPGPMSRGVLPADLVRDFVEIDKGGRREARSRIMAVLGHLSNVLQAQTGERMPIEPVHRSEEGGGTGLGYRLSAPAYRWVMGNLSSSLS